MNAPVSPSQAVLVCIVILMFVTTGTAQDVLPTTKQLPTFDNTKVEDVDLLTRAKWVAQWYLFPEHLEPMVSLYGYRGSDVKCSSPVNNELGIGMAAFVWDIDETVSKTRKLMDQAGHNFLNPNATGYTVNDICLSLKRETDVVKQYEKTTEEKPKLFVITQKPIPNAWPTHRYVVEKKRKTGQGH